MTLNHFYIGNNAKVVNLKHARSFEIIEFKDSDDNPRFFIECQTDQGKVTVSVHKGKHAEEEALEELESICERGYLA